MNIKEYQYYHSIFSHTVACKVPSKEFFLNQLDMYNKNANSSPFPIEIGVSYLHPSDQYCYKTGRELSKARIKPEQYKIRYVNYSKGSIILQLYKEGTSEGIEYLEFEIKHNRKTPYFIAASILYLD